MNAEELRKLRNKLTGGNPQAPAEYYVSPDGNNKDGLSLGNAFKTITKAIDVLNNLPANKKGAVLWIAPGTYIEPAGLELQTDFNIIRCIENMIGRVFIIGSDDFYQPGQAIGIATDNLLKITGRYNIMSGFTLFDNSTDYACLRFEDKSGGGGFGGQNLVEKCFFSPFTEDAVKYCVDIFGGARNYFVKCQFNGPTVAGIFLDKGYGAPVDTIIEDCDFIGTNRGIIIDGENYNTVIRRNWFTAGSRTGENMDNAIEITSGMDLGKVSIYKNNFEQSAINAVSDSKSGGSVFVYGDNEYGV